jgi:hypothetical protein
MDEPITWAEAKRLAEEAREAALLVRPEPEPRPISVAILADDAARATWGALRRAWPWVAFGLSYVPPVCLVEAGTQSVSAWVSKADAHARQELEKLKRRNPTVPPYLYHPLARLPPFAMGRARLRPVRFWARVARLTFPPRRGRMVRLGRWAGKADAAALRAAAWAAYVRHAAADLHRRRRSLGFMWAPRHLRRLCLHETHYEGRRAGSPTLWLPVMRVYWGLWARRAPKAGFLFTRAWEWALGAHPDVVNRALARWLRLNVAYVGEHAWLYVGRLPAAAWSRAWPGAHLGHSRLIIWAKYRPITRTRAALERWFSTYPFGWLTTAPRGPSHPHGPGSAQRERDLFASELLFGRGRLQAELDLAWARPFRQRRPLGLSRRV